MEGRPRETNSKQRRRLSVSVKAALDRTLAAVLLVILGPLILLIALAIRITMGSPVLFRQERLGRDERIFTIKKFRTMDQRPGLPDVERLTPLGRFLRRTSLDELPQLLNIVEGELSFVGPRPLLVRYRPFYTDGERRRHQLTPGLTGWAQIHGRNQVRWNERLALDVWYVDHWSLLLDARIAWRTVNYVLGSHGVELAPSESMDDFDVERARGGSA